MAEDKPKTVTMKALELHTYHGKSYKPGATYEADAGDVETIELQGKGVCAADADPPKTDRPIGKVKR